jgi:hypothetical protein
MENKTKGLLVAGAAGVALVTTGIVLLKKRKAAPVSPPPEMPPAEPGVANVWGRVVGENNNPLGGVTVALVGYPSYITTGSNGKWYFSDLTPKQPYIVNFVKDGYDSASADIFLEEGDNAMGDAQLTQTQAPPPSYSDLPVGPFLTITHLNGRPLVATSRGLGPDQPLVYSDVGSDAPTSITFRITQEIPYPPPDSPYVVVITFNARYTPDVNALGYYRLYLRVSEKWPVGTEMTVAGFTPYTAGGPGAPAGMYDLHVDASASYYANGSPIGNPQGGEVVLYNALQVPGTSPPVIPPPPAPKITIHSVFMPSTIGLLFAGVADGGPAYYALPNINFTIDSDQPVNCHISVALAISGSSTFRGSGIETGAYIQGSRSMAVQMGFGRSINEIGPEGGQIKPIGGIYTYAVVITVSGGGSSATNTFTGQINIVV